MPAGISRNLLALSWLLAVGSTWVTTCQAGLFSHGCGCGEHRFFRPWTASRPVVAACYPVGNTCAPGATTVLQRVVVNYAPQTAYRTQWTQVPLTVYRPLTTTDPVTGCTVTAMRPCTTYELQARRVPYQTLRPVYSTIAVNTAPVSSYHVPSEVRYLPTVEPGFEPGCGTPAAGAFPFASAPYATTPQQAAPAGATPYYSTPSGTVPGATRSAAPGTGWGSTGATGYDATGTMLQATPPPARTVPDRSLSGGGGQPSYPAPATTVPSGSVPAAGTPADRRPQLVPQPGGAPVPRTQSNRLRLVPVPLEQDAESQEPGMPPLGPAMTNPQGAADEESGPSLGPALRPIPDPDSNPSAEDKLAGQADGSSRPTWAFGGRTGSVVPISWPQPAVKSQVDPPTVARTGRPAGSESLVETVETVQSVETDETVETVEIGGGPELNAPRTRRDTVPVTLGTPQLAAEHLGDTGWFSLRP